jgi:predicted DNA-binding ribbon-helix-helix protein
MVKGANIMDDGGPVRRRIPDFASLEEEAAFLDTHDTTEFEEEWESVDLEVARPLMHRLSVRLEGAVFHQLMAIAKQRGLPPSALAAALIREGIARSESAELDGTS